MKRSFRALRSASAITAALATASGCTFLAQLNDEFEVGKDAGVMIVTVFGDSGSTHGGGDGGDDNGMDATTMMSRDSGLADADATVPFDAGPPFDACRANGWHLDCAFGDGGLLLFAPIDSEGGADASLPNGASPFAAVYPNGDVATVIETGTSASALYMLTSDAATESSVIDGVSSIVDVRIVNGSPLLILSTAPFSQNSSLNAIFVSSVVDGSVSSAESDPPAMSLGFGGAFGQIFPYQLLGFDGAEVFALIGRDQTFIPVPQPVIIGFDLEAGTSTAEPPALPQPAIGGSSIGATIGDRTIVVENAADRATQADGATSLVSEVEYTFVEMDGSALPVEVCPSNAATQVTDVIAFPDDAALGIGSGTTGQSFVLFHGEDGGTCARLAAAPTPPIAASSPTMYLSTEDGGFTTSYVTRIATSPTSSVPGVALANFSAEGTLDPSVGRAGYTYAAFASAAKIGRPVRSGNTIYFPVLLDGTTPQLGLVRFIESRDGG